MVRSAPAQRLIRIALTHRRSLYHRLVLNGLGRSLLVAMVTALPASAISHQERLNLSADVGGGCTLTLGADDEARALRLRISPEASRCRASREAVQLLLATAFTKTPSPPGEGTYRSLFIGRLVYFPWLASALVTGAFEDQRWDRRRGRAIGTGNNTYAATLLSTREVTAQLEAPIAASGYRIVSATVEKVLVGDLRSFPEYEGPRPPGKLPFDAMVWFALERTQPQQ
jgi:hypothetical protein